MPQFIKAEKGVLVQGITGKEGRFHAARMLAYGTPVVAGVTPGKGGEWLELGGHKVPVFDTIQSAVAVTDARYAVNFVPAAKAVSSLYEALDAKLEMVISHTRGITAREMMAVMRTASRNGTTIMGPACAGALIPGEAQLGVIPGDYSIPGPIGIISTSGALVFAVLSALTAEGMGQSLVLDIGTEPVKGLRISEALAIMEEEPRTERVLLISTPEGEDEFDAISVIRDSMTKPVYALLAGLAFAEHGGLEGPLRAYAESILKKRDALMAVGVRVVSSTAEFLAAIW